MLTPTVVSRRRLCILKGIHPREPKKKTQGQKTYYHVKDINFLLHEPLLEKLRCPTPPSRPPLGDLCLDSDLSGCVPGDREQQAYEKKIRKAKAKSSADLAKRLATRRPTYTLDRLVKERYQMRLLLCSDFVLLQCKHCHSTVCVVAHAGTQHLWTRCVIWTTHYP